MSDGRKRDRSCHGWRLVTNNGQFRSGKASLKVIDDGLAQRGEAGRILVGNHSAHWNTADKPAKQLEFPCAHGTIQQIVDVGVRDQFDQAFLWRNRFHERSLDTSTAFSQKVNSTQRQRSFLKRAVASPQVQVQLIPVRRHPGQGVRRPEKNLSRVGPEAETWVAWLHEEVAAPIIQTSHIVRQHRDTSASKRRGRSRFPSAGRANQGDRPTAQCDSTSVQADGPSQPKNEAQNRTQKVSRAVVQRQRLGPSRPDLGTRAGNQELGSVPVTQPEETSVGDLPNHQVRVSFGVALLNPWAGACV